MSGRRMDMGHGLPSFAPEWGHPYRKTKTPLEVDVLARVGGGSWDEAEFPPDSMPSWARTHRSFIGFRLVRPG